MCHTEVSPATDVAHMCRSRATPDNRGINARLQGGTYVSHVCHMRATCVHMRPHVQCMWHVRGPKCATEKSPEPPTWHICAAAGPHRITVASTRDSKVAHMCPTCATCVPRVCHMRPHVQCMWHVRGPKCATEKSPKPPTWHICAAAGPHRITVSSTRDSKVAHMCPTCATCVLRVCTCVRMCNVCGTSGAPSVPQRSLPSHRRGTYVPQPGHTG